MKKKIVEKDILAKRRCPSCKRTQTYRRIKTQDMVCRSCGEVTPLTVMNAVRG